MKKFKIGKEYFDRSASHNIQQLRGCSSSLQYAYRG